MHTPVIREILISFFFLGSDFFFKKPVFESASVKGRYKIRVSAELIRPFKRLNGKNTGMSMDSITLLGTFIYKGVI